MATRLFILMSLFALFGCSPRSTDLPASLTALQVEILIEEISEWTAGSAP